MSHTHMRLVPASGEAAGSDEADPLAVGLSVPIGSSEEGESETTAASVALGFGHSSLPAFLVGSRRRSRKGRGSSSGLWSGRWAPGGSLHRAAWTRTLSDFVLPSRLL
jgi:hypothetical protein